MLQHNTGDNASLRISHDQAPADAFNSFVNDAITLKLLSVRLAEESFEMVKPNIQLG